MTQEPEPAPRTHDEAIIAISKASEKIGIAADKITEAVVVLAKDEPEEEELD